MSDIFTVCYTCCHIASHKALRKCEECGSTDVYIDTEAEPVEKGHAEGTENEMAIPETE
jgi:hypothetical protein